MCKKELPYFEIDGNYGGSQSWFLDPWMHIGGCGALTMCDLMLYQAICRGRGDCWPFEQEKREMQEKQETQGPFVPRRLTKRDYRKFGMIMKPYLRPRETGIKDLPTFINGARIFLEDSEIQGFQMEAFDGSRPFDQARDAVRERIDHDMPVPMLMLKHQDNRFSFFEWHWFLIVGYEIRQNEFYVKAATYGKPHWLDFQRFWNTGELEKGGLVLVTEHAGKTEGAEPPEGSCNASDPAKA